MENQLSLTAKSDDNITKTVNFKFIPELFLQEEVKSKSIFLTVFSDEQQVGVLEI